MAGIESANPAASSVAKCGMCRMVVENLMNQRNLAEHRLSASLGHESSSAISHEVSRAIVGATRATSCLSISEIAMATIVRHGIGALRVGERENDLCHRRGAETVARAGSPEIAAGPSVLRGWHDDLQARSSRQLLLADIERRKVFEPPLTPSYRTEQVAGLCRSVIPASNSRISSITPTRRSALSGAIVRNNISRMRRPAPPWSESWSFAVRR